MDASQKVSRMITLDLHLGEDVANDSSLMVFRDIGKGRPSHSMIEI